MGRVKDDKNIIDEIMEQKGDPIWGTLLFVIVVLVVYALTR